MFPVWGSTESAEEQTPSKESYVPEEHRDSDPTPEPQTAVFGSPDDQHLGEVNQLVSPTEPVEATPEEGHGALSGVVDPNATTTWYPQPAVAQPEPVAQPQPATPVPTAQEIAASTLPQPDATPSVAPPPPAEFLAPEEPSPAADPLPEEVPPAEPDAEPVVPEELPPPTPDERDELKDFAEKVGVNDGYTGDDISDDELLEDTDKYYSTAQAAAFFPGRKGKGNKGKSNQWLYWGLREGIFTDLDGKKIEPLRVGKGQRRRFSLSVIREIALSCYRRGNLTEDELKMVLRKILIAKHGEEAFDEG